MDTLNRFECGSVQMKCASVNRTLFSPFSFFRQIDSSSADSGFASVHDVGGARKRSQLRQNDTEAAGSLLKSTPQDNHGYAPCLGIPSVISTLPDHHVGIW